MENQNQHALGAKESNKQGNRRFLLHLSLFRRQLRLARYILYMTQIKDEASLELRGQ